METLRPKIYIGFITYGKTTAKYLPYFLPSLKNQSYNNFKIVAVDNSENKENENADYIKNSFPEVDFKWAGKNLGFAKAFNLMIKQALKDGAEYFLALNPDMILESECLVNLVATIQGDKTIGAVQPKILKWDFENNQKTNQIDSLGLIVTKEHRFSDWRQGELGNLPISKTPSEIFGFTGAAVLLSLKALEDVAYVSDKKKEYFDELMFMYKEDCDLSYRLRLAGWKIILAPAAIVYHNRTVASLGETNLKIAVNRRLKSRQVKQWSFLNQWILLLKLAKLPFSWRIKLATSWYQFKSLAYVLLFEPFLLKELVKLWQLLSEIKMKREQLKIRVNFNEIEGFMK
jgi:GT2 family glycosyltransferase